MQLRGESLILTSDDFLVLPDKGNEICSWEETPLNFAKCSAGYEPYMRAEVTQKLQTYK